MVGEGGVVAAAVIGVKDQRHIQYPGLQRRIAAVLPEHHQEILRGGLSGVRLMDEQAAALGILVGLVGIDGQHRHIGDQLQALTQYVGQADVVGLIVIAVQGQNFPLQRVHQILGRRLQHHILKEVLGQRPPASQRMGEVLQLFPGGQLTEQKQVSRLLKPIAPMHGRALDQLPHVDAPVIQHTILRNDTAVLSHRIGADLRHSGQSGQNALAIFITQAALDTIFSIQGGVNIAVLLPLGFQRFDLRGDLTIGIVLSLRLTHVHQASFLSCSFAIISCHSFIFNPFKQISSLFIYCF